MTNDGSRREGSSLGDAAATAPENARHPQRRLVTVTPAGRRRYVEILANYLLRNRHVIREHHWWVNTRNPEDVAYLLQLGDRYPDFFRIVIAPYSEREPIDHAIWRFMAACDSPDTVYLRLDDDICYVAEGAVEAIYRQRLADPHPFLILGNIVNNAICTHFYQQAGLLPRHWGEVLEECMDQVGWNDGGFTVRLHRWFLDLIATGRVDTLRSVPFAYDGRRRFSINAICWNGDDMAALPERHRTDVDEEPFLTVEVPNRLDRPNVICPGAIFGHFAYWPQRPFVEAVAPEILDRYRRFSGSPNATQCHGSPLRDEILLSAKSAAGRVRWKWHRNTSKLKRFLARSRSQVATALRGRAA
jgi:hypothetical protein